METPAAKTTDDHECALCHDAAQSNGLGSLYDQKVCDPCGRRFFRTRFSAYLVDVAGYYLLGRICVWALGLGSAMDNDPSAWMAIMWIVLVRLPFCCKDGFGGRSPGKWAYDLKVINAKTGRPIGLGTSLVRNLWLLLPIVGELVILLFHRGGMRPGDRMARTRVIYSE